MLPEDTDHTIIDTLYQRFRELHKFLEVNKEPSFQSDIDENSRRTLVLASASYFESEIKTILLEFATEFSGNNRPLVAFLKNKAIERQYHTYFDWDRKNANRFFGLFGEEFKNFMNSRTQNDSDLNEAITAFMELGSTRNDLVHQNFATFYVEKSTEDIYQLFRQALKFIRALPQELRQYLAFVLE